MLCSNSLLQILYYIVCFVILAFCVEAAYQHKVIDYMCSQIVRLASESILSLDLAVIAAYGMTSSIAYSFLYLDFEKPEYIYDLLLDTLVSIESRWLENDAVLQQIITNYIVIAESGKSFTFSSFVSFNTSQIVADYGYQ